ncbi:PKS-NRPS hybrid synthetase [Tanacetum coccineum]
MLGNHLISPINQKNNIETVKNMTLSGIPPRQIISSLRPKNPNLRVNSRTIYNLKAKLRKNGIGNRSLVSKLFEELEKGGFSYDIFHDPNGRITLFLKKEDTESYVWALKAFKEFLGPSNQPAVIMSDRELALMSSIKDVFPSTTSLLCIWHIQKNVFSNCKKDFEHADAFNVFMSMWNIVAYSTTEPLFDKNWAEFELDYKDKLHSVDYIKSTWLPCKEKFVSAWTDRYLHFGNRSSSRAEGAHAKLNKYLQVSTGDLHEVKKKISLAVEHEFNENKVRLATIYKEKGRYSNSLHRSLNTEDPSPNHKDNQFANFLSELQCKYDVWPLSKKELATSMITNLLNESNTLFEPTVIQRPRGIPPKAKKKRGVTSTARDPSRFEYVESSQTHNLSNSSKKLA